MHRLLQGDVGCGKTAVAFYAILAAVANGAQAVIMAPTEILARQHARTFSEFLKRSKKSRVRIGLLVGGMKTAERQTLLAALRGGAVDVVVATHAAIQKDVAFQDLGLVVIDEQHKFGVAQRAVLRQKGTTPDVLVMTATPIPRSLALTLYGDLDVSTIDSLPPGRKRVKTMVPESSAWLKICDFLRREFTAGRQAFIICPLVEENEDLDLKSAVEEYDRLSEQEFSSFRLGLLHGRMKREEQQKVMLEFRKGRLDALVSTVVIEVGVDVPNATILVVLHAERFGLAQLHQLRGRIGRGSRQGYCILLSDVTNPIARERLEIMVKESDGFRIAEEDLRLRGEGEFLGTRQHGHAFKLASIIDDYPVLRRARDDARRLLKNDPMLSGASHQAIREEVICELGDRLEIAGTG
ncbi:MAG: ATP-dependent DNA helicase RecG, partial [Planctomycetes bacterium]|nr:ATP-dependent DNA helicase RecG [Planctomycetota bacterium]